jgi:OmcA/MtrC family decaheme c-type cytochrome
MKRLSSHHRIFGRVLAIIAVLAASLVSATKHQYSPREKAFYANAASVEFVAPGLTITVNSASIAANGAITATYTLTDPNGLPLDSAGVSTPGTISVSLVAATIPANQEQYTTYTTKSASGTLLGTIQQPGADSGGTTTVVAPGQYQYTFATKAPAGFDVTATHTIGVYGSRTLTEYNLPTNYASATYNFVPNGAKVTKTRDVIETASCDTCHDQLSAHGGSRRGMNMCVLCHTPQNSDPNTGATLDAKVFFHMIHMGASLPTVVAGETGSCTTAACTTTPYIPAINSFGSFNYSTVVFPATPADPRDCEVCHSQKTGAAQATAFLTNPTRVACGSCHDNVNFATGANHPGGPQFDDTQCSTCHIPQGTDFDASILGAHVVPTSSSLLSGLNVTITKVTGGTAGSAPTVYFTVLNNAKAPVPLSQLSSISFTMAGPTSDYGYTIFGTNAGTPGYVTESAAKASCDNNGNCIYTFTNVVPASSTGTYAIGVEARETQTVVADTAGTQNITYGAPNVVAYFSVDGSTVAPRRTVVALANCNGCHQTLQVHGALRNNTEYCVMCHNPSNTDASTRAAGPAPYSTQPSQGINFNLLVHRIHYGINMQAVNRTYVVIGFGGSVNDFSSTLFPALSPTGAATDTENCSLCHVNSTEQNDLILTGLHAVIDPQGPINPIQPFSSACTGCHMDIPTAVHTLTNTTTLGEACAVCHSSGAIEAVDAVHAQY